jgi:hypothetical protein
MLGAATTTTRNGSTWSRYRFAVPTLARSIPAIATVLNNLPHTLAETLDFAGAAR